MRCSSKLKLPGKTCFLFYVLCRRLCAGLPTAFQLNEDEFAFFTENGPVVEKSTSRYPFPSGTWLLADSNAMVSQPCGAFLRSTIDVLVVQTTSPKVSRWKEWSKQRQARVFVMDWISRDEMIALGYVCCICRLALLMLVIRSLLCLDCESLLKNYDTFGPSARECIKMARGRESRKGAKAKVAGDVQRLITQPSLIVPFSQHDIKDDVPHRIFFVRPRRSDRSEGVTQIPTNYLCRVVLRTIAQAEAARQVDIFHHLDCHPSTRGSSGELYEKFIHARLTAHPSLHPLECTASDRHLKLAIPVCRNVLSFSGVSGLNSVNDEELPFYWRPLKTNFPSLDIIICTLEMILMIQVTRLWSGRHKILREGVIDTLTNLPKGFADARRKCLIFVTDSDIKALRLRQQGLKTLEGLGLEVYSCVFQIGWMDNKEIDALIPSTVRSVHLHSRVLSDLVAQDCNNVVNDRKYDLDTESSDIEMADDMDY
jgi:hypothetical protein